MRIFTTTGRILLGILAASFGGGLLLWGPFGDFPGYHSFADRREFLGIPNFADVVSNLVFILAGMWGFIRFVRRRLGTAKISKDWMSFLLFAGLVMTGIGSAYYHWEPDDLRLFWDRLPLTFVMMSFFALVLEERLNLKRGLWVGLGLLALGAGSVIYWRSTLIQGAPDVRLYAIAQYYPMVAIPILLFFFPAREMKTRDLVFVLGLYGLAKAFEVLDRFVFSLGQAISGHTIKHLVAGLAGFVLCKVLVERGDVPCSPTVPSSSLPP